MVKCDRDSVLVETGSNLVFLNAGWRTYSARSVILGSTRLARIAGARLAASATSTSSSTAVPENTVASYGDISQSKGDHCRDDGMRARPARIEDALRWLP